MTLAEIVEQLELCGFECEGGPLKNNVAFIELKNMTNTITEAREAALRKEGAVAERERIAAELSKVHLYVAEAPILLGFGKKYLSAYAMRDIKRILTQEDSQ